MITGFYAGLLGLMLVILILRIIKKRWKFRVGIGDGGIAELSQAIRVHGNFIETVPIMLIFLALMEYSLVNAPFLHAFGIGIVLSRLLHAWGITQTPLTSSGRKFGTLLTLFLLLSGSFTLIFLHLR